MCKATPEYKKNLIKTDLKNGKSKTEILKAYQISVYILNRIIKELELEKEI